MRDPPSYDLHATKPALAGRAPSQALTATGCNSLQLTATGCNALGEETGDGRQEPIADTRIEEEENEDERRTYRREFVIGNL